MLLPGKFSPKTWLFVTILVSTIIAYSESSAGKTHSAEYNPRAVDENSSSDSNSSSGSSKKKTSPRAESSGSVEKGRSKKEEAKEPAKAPKSSNSDDDDDEKNSGSREEKVRSTRGLKAGDFEPEEENPKIHARYKKNSESAISDDKSGERRRYRRSIDRFDDNEGAYV
ncbi:pre-mRNA-splicing factor CWC22 homolog [Helicoverpa armigera]|uniref:pre-mRNA-splicing factor CWC22 homolog n=1 Tax=Helicoverpa armigera TaxID=29058 RepID=UPI00308370AE